MRDVGNENVGVCFRQFLPGLIAICKFMELKPVGKTFEDELKKLRLIIQIDQLGLLRPCRCCRRKNIRMVIPIHAANLGTPAAKDNFFQAV